MSEPTWRTTTVTDLITSMRHTADFSALPILADALEDAGYDNAAVLAELRGGPHDFATGCIATAKLLGGQLALSLQWIAHLALTLRYAEQDEHDRYDENPDNYSSGSPLRGTGQQMSAHFLIAAARRMEVENDITWQYGGQSWMGAMNAHRYTEFWRHYAAVTGTEFRDRGSFISCSC